MAHRLDENLTASLISISRESIEIQMRLLPGASIASQTISSLDANHDDFLSPNEKSNYAQRILAETFLEVDGIEAQLKIKKFEFPTLQEIREGTGTILITLSAASLAGDRCHRLHFENRRARRTGVKDVYLINVLSPDDVGLEFGPPLRDGNQSWLEINYSVSRVQDRSSQSSQPSQPSQSSGGSNFKRLFGLGLLHIADGADHLLFLIALLLPAPLVAAGGRWAGRASLKTSTLGVLKIVSAFTLGHSLTLTLASIGLVHAPTGPVEIAIAVSILVSAAHAIFPLFRSYEAGIALFFGFIHGLAFAATLSALGLKNSNLLVGILAFNLGIEAMQLGVVGSLLPSLLLLSQNRFYSFFRVGGAILAGAASLAWIAERSLGLKTPIDQIADRVLSHGVLILASFFIVSAGVAYQTRNQSSGHFSRR